MVDVLPHEIVGFVVVTAVDLELEPLGEGAEGEAVVGLKEEAAREERGDVGFLPVEGDRDKVGAEGGTVTGGVTRARVEHTPGGEV